MEIAPTKCIVGNSYRSHAGQTVYVTEIAAAKGSLTGIMCKVMLPSKAKKRRATWLDMGHLIRIKEEATYGSVTSG